MALFCDDVSAIVRCACAATPWLSSGPCDCATATDEPAKERTAGTARTPTIRIGNAARPCMHGSPIVSVARQRTREGGSWFALSMQMGGRSLTAFELPRSLAAMPPEIRPRFVKRDTGG